MLILSQCCNFWTRRRSSGVGRRHCSHSVGGSQGSENALDLPGPRRYENENAPSQRFAATSVLSQACPVSQTVSLLVANARSRAHAAQSLSGPCPSGQLCRLACQSASVLVSKIAQLGPKPRLRALAACCGRKLPPLQAPPESANSGALTTTAKRSVWEEG